MTIYDVKFYGVWFHYKMEFSDVIICSRREDVHAVPGFDNEFFEVTVLKEYDGKQDVLKIEFKNGETTYKTLNYPYLYLNLEDKVWRKSCDTSTQQAFMKAYFSFRSNS